LMETAVCRPVGFLSLPVGCVDPTGWPTSTSVIYKTAISIMLVSSEDWTVMCTPFESS
jgi:hypothetical protein